MRLLESLIALIFFLLVLISVLNIYKFNLYYQSVKENLYATEELAGIISYTLSFPGNLSANITLNYDNMTELRIYLGYEGKYKVSTGYCYEKNFWNDIKKTLKESIFEAFWIDQLLILSSMIKGVKDETTIKYASIKFAHIVGERITEKLAEKTAEKVVTKAITKKVEKEIIKKALRFAGTLAAGTGIGLLIDIGVTFLINFAGVLYDWITLKADPEKQCINIGGKTWKWDEAVAYNIYGNYLFPFNVWNWRRADPEIKKSIYNGFTKYRGQKKMKWIFIEKKDEKEINVIIG